jgi:glutathione S-transferase
MGKVPAIRHRDTVVTEVAAICAYLADAFPEARLAPPANDPLRGPYYRWLFFAAGPIEMATSNKALGFIVSKEREVFVGYGRFDTVMDTLDEALLRVYRGRSLSGLAYRLRHAVRHDRETPRLRALLATSQQPPAWRRATEIDDALTKPAQPNAQSGEKEK